MHRVIKSYLNDFSSQNGYEKYSESDQFEFFVNMSILSSKLGNDFDLEEVTTENGEDGMDGVAVIINEELVVSCEDVESIFESGRRNNDVEFVFVQSKVSDSFDLGDFLKFKESILRFCELTEYNVGDDIQKNARHVFDMILSNLSRVRGGRARFTARYVSTGIYKSPRELEDAKNKFTNQINELSIFHDIDVEFVDRNMLTQLWVSTYSSVTAELPMLSHAPLPEIHGIEEAYLVVVKAKELVDNLLKSEDGSLRNYVFEENVRAFLGVDNPVNKSIADTLGDDDSATRFPVLNNGITVVSPNVMVQGNKLRLENFQIVNGCQTSNVLYECRENLDDSIMVNLKVVETSNEEVFSQLVRATNSQSKVDENQFFSLSPIMKRVETYFNTYEGQDGRLYFERRERQYINHGQNVPAIRTFSVKVAARCVTAMFLRKPELAHSYPTRMFKSLGEEIFNDETRELVFYAACLSLYRLHLLVASADIPQNMRQYKWHILVLVGVVVAGENVPRLNSKKMDAYCQKIVDKFSKPGRGVVLAFQKAVRVIEAMGSLSRDDLKKQSTLPDMLVKLKEID